MQLGASRFVVVAAQLKERLDRDHLRQRSAYGRRSIPSSTWEHLKLGIM